MDTDAVIARDPRVVLVDELAHTNAPGSRHEKRYQDVEDLLESGIDVISTVNVQHIESLNDIVRQVTGVEVRETIPDRVVDEAEQVELIDMAPEALIRRMVHGNIYPPEQARRALDNFFTLGNLTALRDLALRATAREVEEKLSAYMEGRLPGDARPIGERVMVAVDHRPMGRKLVRRGWRMAAALKAELYVVHVEPNRPVRAPVTLPEDRQLRMNLQLADELGAQVIQLSGDVSTELMAFARTHAITHLVIGPPSHGRWHELLHGSLTHTLVRRAHGIDVHVVSEYAPPVSPDPIKMGIGWHRWSNRSGDR